MGFKTVSHIIVRLIFIAYTLWFGRELIQNIPNPFAVLQGNFGAFFGNMDPRRWIGPLIKLVVGFVAFKMYCFIIQRRMSVVTCLLW